MGLCFRCEWRAQFLENKRRPRYECGNIEKSNCSCYMYKPVKPVTLTKNEGDPRPVGSGILAARSSKAEEEMNLTLKAEGSEDKYVMYWGIAKDDDSETSSES